MRFVERADFVDVIISVDLNNFRQFGAGRYITSRPALLNKSVPNFASFQVNLNLRPNEVDKFRNNFQEVLKCDLSDRSLKKLDINFEQQQDDLIFILDYLKKITCDLDLKMRSDGLQTFSGIVAVMDKINDVNPEDGIKFIFLKEGAKPNPTITLPTAPDAKELYRYISKAIYDYFLDSAQSFDLQWHLNKGHKEDVTLELMKEYLNDINSKKQPEILTNICYLIHSSLSFTGKMPQLASKSTELNTLTTKQARFFLKLFQLFGFYNKNYKINISNNPQISVRQLQEAYSRFMRDHTN